MLTFSFTEGGQSRTLKLSQDEITLGRSRECVVVCRNIKASRKHAKIERLGSLYQITDLDSGNGTKVNGEKVSFHTLEVGDEIRIGDAVLVLKAVDDAVDLGGDDEAAASAKTDVALKKTAPLENEETELEVKTVEAPKKPAKPAFKLELKKPDAAKPAAPAKPGGLGLKFGKK
jgi:pSer/pThr/pTyr-binding forkhead associated (FHA) protein